MKISNVPHHNNTCIDRLPSNCLHKVLVNAMLSLLICRSLRRFIDLLLNSRSARNVSRLLVGFIFLWMTNLQCVVLLFADLDVLVNNAGANWAESFDTYPDAAFEKVINLNLKRVFSLTQA